MNTSSSKIRVKKLPHWKTGAPLKCFSFVLNDEQRKALKMSSMRMRGFKHKFQRDVETNVTQVYHTNEKVVLADIRDLFPDLEIKVRKVFIPYGVA